MSAGRGPRATPAGPRPDPRAHQLRACTPTPHHQGGPSPKPSLGKGPGGQPGRSLGCSLSRNGAGLAPRSEVPAPELWPGRAGRPALTSPSDGGHQADPARPPADTQGRGRPGKFQRALLSLELQPVPCPLQDPTCSTLTGPTPLDTGSQAPPNHRAPECGQRGEGSRQGAGKEGNFCHASRLCGPRKLRLLPRFPRGLTEGPAGSAGRASELPRWVSLGPGQPEEEGRVDEVDPGLIPGVAPSCPSAGSPPTPDGPPIGTQPLLSLWMRPAAAEGTNPSPPPVPPTPTPQERGPVADTVHRGPRLPTWSVPVQGCGCGHSRDPWASVWGHVQL